MYEFRIQSLCVFDWNLHSEEQIKTYREAEVPFVVRNNPTLLQTAERWNSHVPSSNHHDKVPYLIKMLGQELPQKTEVANKSNHMTFWRNAPEGYAKTTETKYLTIQEWWDHNTVLEKAHMTNQTIFVNMDHYYYKVDATKHDHTFIYDELPIFDPRAGSTLFMVQPQYERGINCRLGMTGTRADNHFDSTRNWIVLLGGMRRYILSPPEECSNLNLFPLHHVSARHMKDDVANVTKLIASGNVHNAKALNVVLQSGDALYLPTSWFHLIISLTTTFQCNARSGSTQIKGSTLHRTFQDCGFDIYEN